MKLTSPFLSSGASASTAIRTPTALGSRILDQRTIRSWVLPGSAQRCLPVSRLESASAIVRENVLLGPARQIEQSPCRKEVEAGLGKSSALFPIETLVELFLELVEIAHVARGIFALGFAELAR